MYVTLQPSAAAFKQAQNHSLNLLQIFLSFKLFYKCFICVSEFLNRETILLSRWLKTDKLRISIVKRYNDVAAIFLNITFEFQLLSI